MDPNRGLTPELVAEVKDSEGWYPSRYIDPVGYETIGYGHRVRPGDHFDEPLTLAAGEALLLADLHSARDAAVRLSPCLVTASERRLAAITDFCFNIGAGKYSGSHLKIAVDAKNWHGAAQQMLLWVHAGQTVLRGLVKRRTLTARWLDEG